MTSIEDADLREDVLWRGLRQGTGIGALMGAASGAAIPCTMQAQPGHSWYALLAGSLAAMAFFAVPGLFVGAMVGFVCALVPSAVLTAGRGYFRRHACAARLCTVSIGLLVQVYVIVRTAREADYQSCELFAIPMGIGLILAAACAHYVLTGQGFRLHLRSRRPRLG